ncbi:MAG: hypothetical protein A3E36_04855 [Candidatus Andersenbacteria bacterium RIFCSPHIGHO2_12_FULL_45_11b]|uniref:Uncharacterized protein n=1 Tax=Candidatus Andersenbacteria bacterium RIFCSPHIGHO2_12_FULL_45_11b TaxID=1797282 RepID=A0A1G1XC61_9BACT|nr:MAG: hypothetical protein A3E36_04855 [Candidatus Andersenbacteria bacterium RIFCSPHIGHO2_12_FULL_45_11b]
MQFFENLHIDAIVAEFSVFESFLKGLTVMTDTRLALCDVRGPLNDLTEKLCGEESEAWLVGLKKFLRKENPWEHALQASSPIASASPTKTYPTPFVPGLTWKDRIERCRFDYVDPEIWQYIDSFVEAEEEHASPIHIELDRFGKSMSSSGAESFQAKNGKNMISPARFLSLCETYPNLQREDPIICTQKICVDRHGEVRVLFALEYDGERGLYLGCRDGVWSGYCRFPSTRKVS